MLISKGRYAFRLMFGDSRTRLPAYDESISAVNTDWSALDRHVRVNEVPAGH